MSAGGNDIIITELLRRNRELEQEVARLQALLPKPVVSGSGALKKLREVSATERHARVLSLSHVAALPCFQHITSSFKSACYHGALEAAGLVDTLIQPNQF